MSAEGLEFQKICWLSDNYQPTKEQMAFHSSKAWLRLVAGGVRAGKSYSTAREVDKYTAIEDGLGWLIGPDYEQPRAEFLYLYGLYDRLGFIDRSSVSIPTKGPCGFTTLWGFRWETKSAGKDTRSLASFAPNVLVLCEAAQQPYSVVDKAIERATQEGADIIMSGTFETSMGWYPELFTKFSGPNEMGGESFSIPSWSNIVAFPGGEDDPKILRAKHSMPPELFAERYGGVPTKPANLVFRHFDRRIHILDCKYDPTYPLEIAVDPGNHAYSILFIQRRGPDVFILDEIYKRNVIAQQIIPLYLEHPYSYIVTIGVMDIAGKQHQANYSQLEVWQNEIRAANRTPVSFSVRKIFETDWRNAIAYRLGNDGTNPPHLFLSTKLSDKRTADNKALGIISELEMYTWPKRGETANLPFRPVKANEDALSALGYYLVHNYGAVLEREPVLNTKKTFSYFF